MSYAVVTQGIDDSIDDCRWRADGAGFTGAFDTQRIGRAGHLIALELNHGQVVGSGHGVIHETGREQLTRITLVGGVFQQRLPCQ